MNAVLALQQAEPLKRALQQSYAHGFVTDVDTDALRLAKWRATRDGITGFQMDIKIQGVPMDVRRTALAQARDGRMHILGEMAKALSAGRQEFSVHAPRIETMQINPDKIREVIGSGGSVIREIVAESGAKIDIDDDGTVKIASAKGESFHLRKWSGRFCCKSSPRRWLWNHHTN